MSDAELMLLRLAAARNVRADLDAHIGALVRGHFDPARCARWVSRIRDARDQWTDDFGGAQFSLGRAFYTHLEEERTRAYFADAAASDARVEAHAPGLQDAMIDLVALLTGGRVGRRAGFCGPGVHVFPAGNEVARRGGVVHFDTEGLARHHLAARRPALSIVAMLQTPERGGGLRLWDLLYAGRDAATPAELEGARCATIRSEPGDVVAFDSYRLHQIQALFGPARSDQRHRPRRRDRSRRLGDVVLIGISRASGGTRTSGPRGLAP